MTSPAKKLASPPAPPCATDGELLMRFVRHRDRSAIGELVHKHAPMVMAVCRQVLGGRADAEDAFQATFLILVKRARAIERKSCVAGWLYRVAYRTAMRLAVRRRRDRSEPLVAEPAGEPEVFSIISERETRRTLHEEIARLPSKYREPILLFYFAGKTREEIAEELECTDATVKGRLARGRQALRLALARRGVGLSVALGAAVAATPSSTAAAAALADKTILACTSALERGADVASCSPKAIQLANEGVRAMLFSTVVKIAVAPAIVGVAIVAFAQLPDSTDEPPRAAATASGLVLANDPIESQDSAGSVAISTTEAAPAVIVSSDNGGALTADALRLHVADLSGVIADPLHNPLQNATPPEVDTATSEMLANYYEQRAKASDVRQAAKRREIEAYAREAAVERERMLRDAKQLELEADILDLRAESELFSSRAKLLRDQMDGAETAPSRTDASTTAPATGARDIPDTTAGPPPTAARATDTIQPGDRLMIEVLGGQPPQPVVPLMNEAYTVEGSGNVALGAAFGRVPVGDLNLMEAEVMIRNYLKDYIENPQVQVTRPSTDASETQLESLHTEIRDLRAELEALRGGSRPETEAVIDPLHR
jgi:RNA polymerase sigma factor (sigma-70 family)